MGEHIVDITIIGGGPTGLAAAYYGAHRDASVRIVESLEQLGGQVAAAFVVAGAGVRPGYHGRWPGLANSYEADLTVTTDYRQVLADIVSRRFAGSIPTPLTPSSLPPAPITSGGGRSRGAPIPTGEAGTSGGAPR